MARQSSSTVRTVRFYEEAGLIQPVQRTDGGHRLFPKRELHRLRLVSDLRAAGLSLDDIRDLLDAKLGASSRAKAANSVLTRLDEQLGSMRARVTLLQRLLGELQGAQKLLQKCRTCDSQKPPSAGCDGCSILDAVDELPPAFGVLWHLER